MDYYEGPNILFLENVQMSDCNTIDKMMLEKFAETNTDVTDIFIPDDVPDKFISNETWIPCTNRKCVSCTLKINGSPIFIPSHFSKVDNNTIAYVDKTIGLVCSFPCGMRQICTSIHDDQWKHNAKDRLKFLYYMIYKKEIMKIPLSYDKCKMNIYIGDWDIYKYKERNKELSNLIE